MKRALMVCTTASMIGNFNLPNLKLLQQQGSQVDVACNFKTGSNWADRDSDELKQYLKNNKIRFYQIDFARSPFKLFDNLNAYNELKSIITKNNYTYVHCHTPVGSVITRLITAKLHIPVIYTAHGFHFFKGAPLKNWLLYYPVEKWLSRYTDILITINDEDFKIAKNKMNAKKTIEIPGAGVVTSKFYKNKS